MFEQAIFKVHNLIYGEQARQKEGARIYGYPEYSLLSGFTPLPSVGLWGADFAGAYDGIVDFNKFKAAGGKFAIIKAADGTVKAKYWDENRAAAIAAGVPFGPYFWLYRNIRISGKAQAAAWWNIVKDNPGQLPGTIDFEWTKWAGKQDNPDTSDLYGAAIPYEALAGRKPMIYSAPGYLDQFFNHADMWKAYLLWLAQYGVMRPDAITPWGAGGHTFWQFTDHLDGSLIGVDPANSKAVDGDIYNGTLDQFNAQFNVTSQPGPAPDPIPQPPIGGSMTTKGTAKTGTSTNVKRMDTGAILTLLKDGMYVYGNLSSAGTDIVGFDHYYNSFGVRVELGAACKVSIGNLIVTTEAEPSTNPTPTPTPPPATVTKTHQIDVYSDGSIHVDGNPYP